ncbi:hypothetical protein [Microbacterium sp. MPKO10]|uniref:hypothetical protein n=1 Tax=Microbacterium sp. MPKO10 TaxID=2989818 RepID=UPI002236078A|nr:hypothetical protein [Microbacterium sp. MPKO10]MCW4456920.1 hypothetical protein [Microbacterium sp. MPKO10]
MTHQNLWSQPSPPSAVVTALISSGSVVALSVVETMLTAAALSAATATSFSLSLGMNLGMIAAPLVPMLLFALAAFVSLAFLKPVPHTRPFTEGLAPVLVAGGIGFVVSAAFELISEIFASLGGEEFRLNIGSLISTSIVFTLVLALGAFAVRARYQARELSEGVPTRSTLILVALVVAATLVEAVVVWLLPVLARGDFGTVFADIWLPATRGVMFAAAAFVAIVLLRPVTRIHALSDVLILTLVGGALGYVAIVIFEFIRDAVQGELEFFFPGVFINSLIYALDGAAVLALSVLVVLALRGQRVLMRAG